MKELTQEILKELLDYNPDTGVFTAIVDSNKPSINMPTRWKSGQLRGHDSANGKVLSLGGITIPAHKAAWLYVYGEFPKWVYHKDRNARNNRLDNLTIKKGDRCSQLNGDEVDELIKNTGIKPIPGYELTHGAMINGDVYTFNYKNKKGALRKLVNCRLVDKRKGSKSYYQRVKLFSKTTPVHRIVALTFIPNPCDHPEVNHIDGVKENNHVDNLEWCTTKENNRHAVLNGLDNHPIGSDHWNSSLTNETVLSIKEDIKNTEHYHGMCKDIGEKYGISGEHVSSIKTGKSWSKVS